MPGFGKVKAVRVEQPLQRREIHLSQLTYQDSLFVDNFLVISCQKAQHTFAETGKSATFNEDAGTLFLLWFYPIGIWFIQPRINRLYARTLER